MDLSTDMFCTCLAGYSLILFNILTPLFTVPLYMMRSHELEKEIGLSPDSEWFNKSICCSILTKILCVSHLSLYLFVVLMTDPVGSIL